MIVETWKRSLLKTISWRIFGAAITSGLIYILTGQMAVAAIVGGLDIIVKSIAFLFHERVWNKIRYGKVQRPPFVIWLTGLPGAGKTTVAEELVKKLSSRGFNVEHLDGDGVRQILPKTGFSREERNRHIERVGYLASRLEKNNVVVVASFISPYEESRHKVRSMCERFYEVHVNTPLEECERRDPKGLYRKARIGEIKNLTGLQEQYESPKNPELILDTTQESVQNSARRILGDLSQRNWI